MSVFEDVHQKELRAAGWRSRGYLPHFDGAKVPQFITFHLFDSIPRKVIERWKLELRFLSFEQERILLHRRIEKYLDHGYGQCFLRDKRVAQMVQNSLLKFDGSRYRLFAWVVMPNHVHSLLTCFEGCDLEDVMHSVKSYTAHEERISSRCALIAGETPALRLFALNLPASWCFPLGSHCGRAGFQ